ncbi:MAG: DUF2802 domain-containing protein [Proteobacteria bacterium]|nr:DUF2802 domain-containing protein [Pseudomonadota bacterium]
MFTQPLNLDEWLLIGRAVFLVFSFVLAAVTFSAWRRAAVRQTTQALAHDEEVMKRLDALDARIVAARTLVAQVSETLERSLRADAASSRALSGYPIAIRLARGGATAQELVETCGISHSEAELVCRLHGTPQALTA